MKNMNPHQFSAFVLQKTIIINKKKIYNYLLKKYVKFHSNFFYMAMVDIFSSINKNPQGPKNLCIFLHLKERKISPSKKKCV